VAGLVSGKTTLMLARLSSVRA